MVEELFEILVSFGVDEAEDFASVIRMIFWIGVALYGFSEASWCVRMGSKNGLAADHDENVLSSDGGSCAQDMPQLLGVHCGVVRICCRDETGEG